jgi:hypothetical protein
MTQTSTPAALPAFDMSCENRGNHSLSNISGHDVLVTVVVGAVTRVRIADTYEGANATEALEATAAIRMGAVSKGGYAYMAQKWSCGCSQAGYVARTGGVEFIA